jgi:mannosyltransferase
MEALGMTHQDATAISSREATEAMPVRRWDAYAERILWCAAAIGALVFIAVGIERSMWLDEANSVLIASGGITDIMESLRRENNPPAYFFLLWGWMKWFGDSEVALRALSGIFYLGGIVVCYGIGREVFADRRAAGYGALFYLMSSLAIRQAQNVRMYSLLGLGAGLSTLAFLRLLRGDRSARTWGLYIGVNALGVLTHVWFAFVLAGQLTAAAAWQRKQWPRFAGAAVVSGLPFALLWGPGFWAQLHNGATDWMRFGLWFAADALLGFYGGPARMLVYILAAALAGMAGRQAIARFAGRDQVRIVAVVFSVSLLLPLAVSVFKPIYWPGRYTIIALPPLAVLLGGVYGRLAPRPIAVAICALFLATGLWIHVRSRDQVPESATAEGTDRATVEFLLAHARPGDAVVFTSLTRAAADYYLRRAGAARKFIEISFPMENARHPGWTDPSAAVHRRSAFEAEASEIVLRLRSVTSSGGRIWFYYGVDRRTADILKDRFEVNFAREADRPLSGPYHRGLLTYAAPQPSTKIFSVAAGLPADAR